MKYIFLNSVLDYIVNIVPKPKSWSVRLERFHFKQRCSTVTKLFFKINKAIMFI